MHAPILAIDTSCDETAVAVVSGFEIWSNVVASQVELHKPYGGVFPTVAKQAHKEAIWPAIALALKQARVSSADISEVVVTVGPGLAPALEVGISAAVVLATAWNVPLRPANHLEGHLMSVLARPRQSARQNKSREHSRIKSTAESSHRSEVGSVFTTTGDGTALILGILVSGGHTAFIEVKRVINSPQELVQLEPSIKLTDSATSLLGYLTGDVARKLSIDPNDLDFSLMRVKSVATNQSTIDRFPNLSLTAESGKPWLHSGQFEFNILGNTLDDAAGEALDKIGRMLNLGYPAGPVLEQFAKKGDPQKYELPLPLTRTKSYDLSYSGIKTHTRNLVDSLGGSNQLSKQQIYDLSASVQYAIFRHICYKLNTLISSRKTEDRFAEIWLGGGVVANAQLRRMIRQTISSHKRTKNQPLSSIKVRTPYTKKLCGDNAGMVGVTRIN